MKEYIMGTNDWTQADGGYNGHPASAHGGSYNACFFYDGWSDIVTRLISPRLEFGPNIFNTRLTFWLAMEEWCYEGIAIRMNSPSTTGHPAAVHGTC